MKGRVGWMAGEREAGEGGKVVGGGFGVGFGGGVYGGVCAWEEVRVGGWREGWVRGGGQ